MPAIAVGEARRAVERALRVLRGRHLALRFIAYPSVDARLCLVLFEQPDGSDLLEFLVEFDEAISDPGDEFAIEKRFFCAPDAGALH
jgi:hypothetical protein